MRLLLVAAALSVCRLAVAAPGETLCSDQPARLAARAGVYVPTRLLAQVRTTRRWDLALKTPVPSGITEVRIGRDGRVGLSWAWHEGAVLGREIDPGCLRFDGTGLQLEQRGQPVIGPFVAVAGASRADDEDGPYFDLLFAGCYTAAGSGERWCFDTHRVTVGGKRRTARFKVDLSELPEAGSLLEVSGDDRFWLFVPRGDGWAVYRTGWVSAPGYQEPDWAHPWTVLNRAL